MRSIKLFKLLFRAAFEGFLPLYPYCFAYWKKMSDIESKHGNMDRFVDFFFVFSFRKKRTQIFYRTRFFLAELLVIINNSMNVD